MTVISLFSLPFHPFLRDATKALTPPPTLSGQATEIELFCGFPYLDSDILVGMLRDAVQPGLLARGLTHYHLTLAHKPGQYKDNIYYILSAEIIFNIPSCEKLSLLIFLFI